MQWKKGMLILVAIGLLAACAGRGAAAAEKKLTLWSHWADEDNKKEWVMKAVNDFKKANPDFKVDVVWYQKTQLITSLAAALESGTGPDIFYLEPKNTGYAPYVDNGVMYDISKYVDPYIEDWAMVFAKEGDMTYLLPLEASMPMMYYNTDVMKQAGVTVPASNSFTLEEFEDAVKKIKAAGFTPMSAGTMDRNYVAAILIDPIVLRTIGLEAWQGIATGKTAWTDPGVVSSLKYMERIVKEGAYPAGVSSIKLGESHGLFFGGKYAMFPMKTFFGGRAFVPEEKGGMRKDYPLGIMDMPTVTGGKGNGINYIQIIACYGVNAASQYPEKAAELLTKMCTKEMTSLWINNVKVQTGLKSDASGSSDPYIQAMEKVSSGSKLVAGPMFLGMEPSYMDVYLQTSTALVAGQISADDMIKKLEDARKKFAGGK